MNIKILAEKLNLSVIDTKSFIVKFVQSNPEFSGVSITGDEIDDNLASFLLSQVEAQKEKMQAKNQLPGDEPKKRGRPKKSALVSAQNNLENGLNAAANSSTSVAEIIINEGIRTGADLANLQAAATFQALAVTQAQNNNNLAEWLINQNNSNRAIAAEFLNNSISQLISVDPNELAAKMAALQGSEETTLAIAGLLPQNWRPEY